MNELMAAAAIAASCSWDKPGNNPFGGNVPAAVDAYKDIPAQVRAALKRRMQARQYDEVATITRDAVTGKHAYAPDLTEMHFGAGKLCRTVSRAKWSAEMVERGLVYCESGHCVIVPTVCRNVSRIVRLPGAAGGGAGVAPVVADAGAVAPAAPAPVDLPPTAAGPLAGPEPATFAQPMAPVDVGSFAGSGAWPAFAAPGPAWVIPGPVVVLPPAPTPAVPEPAGWVLMLCGLAGLALKRIDWRC